ncbi:hypothetical protein FGIG_03549 [Fasciola gigantica]|uniref:Uncharacterized protein n=1 Tax=Fasciola gigantica TaxID=46835 RepID=A0A504YS88_FASGI|nr:hypothetical protein FGIG_03549 [Fasciola gigantica]
MVVESRRRHHMGASSPTRGGGDQRYNLYCGHSSSYVDSSLSFSDRLSGSVSAGTKGTLTATSTCARNSVPTSPASAHSDASFSPKMKTPLIVASCESQSPRSSRSVNQPSSTPTVHSMLLEQANGPESLGVTEVSRELEHSLSPHEISGDHTDNLDLSRTRSDANVVTATHMDAIDTTMTQVKLAQLRHDVLQLESALHKNTTSQKELEDWLFEQMGMIGISGNGSLVESSRTGDFDTNVKRRYEEHTRLLTQQSKALRDQLQATRYVITQLEVQGIPIGISPKLYVRQLLKGRSKSTSGQPPPKPGIIEPMPSTLVNETNIYRKPSELASFTLDSQGERSFPARSSSTLPAMEYQHSSPPHARQSRTLPAGTDYLTTSIPKRPSNASFKAIFVPEPSQPWNDLKTVVSSASLLAKALEPDNQVIGVPANTQYTGSPHASIFSYPTSPEGMMEDSTDRGSKQAQRFYQTGASKQQPTHSGNVLHTVYHGLGHFGRRLKGRTRSASAENLFTGSLSDYQSPIPPSKTRKSRFWGRSPWPSSSVQRSWFSFFASAQVSIIEKPSEHGPSGGANNSELSRIRHKVLHYLTDLCVSFFALLTMLLQVIIRAPKRGAKGVPISGNLPLDQTILQSPERSVTMDARMPSKNRSQTESMSSTGGLVLGGAAGGHLSVPVANGLGSVAGLGGLAAFKAHTYSELNAEDGAANLLSEEANECTLARILELLGSTSALAPSTAHTPSAPCEHPVGRVGSSGSSISVSALPSNGVKPATTTPDGHALSVSQQQIAPHLLLTTPAPGTQAPGATASSLTYKVALAFTVFYRLHNAQLAALKIQQANAHQDLREELNAMRRENLDLQNSINNLTAELGAIRRDAHTREELQNQKLSNAIARIEQLDATAEQSRQSLQHDLVNLHNEFRDGLYSLEYQLTTKTRDLSDNIATISNKVSIIEKPSEHGPSGGANNSELSRIRHKVLHYLTDLCVSFFALLTMLLQVIISSDSICAYTWEFFGLVFRVRAISFSVILGLCFLLVYIADPLINVLNDRDVRNTSSVWRDVAIGFLSVFRRFSRSSS